MCQEQCCYKKIPLRSEVATVGNDHHNSTIRRITGELSSLSQCAVHGSRARKDRWKGQTEQRKVASEAIVVCESNALRRK